MKITSKISVNMSGASSKVSKLKSNKALGLFLANEARNGMQKYVPKRTGALILSATTTPFHVIYNAPYAKYPYNGRGTISQDKNPNATSHWDEAYAIADGQKLGEAGTRFLKSL